MIQTKCVYVAVSCDRAERSPQHVLRNVLPKGKNWGLYDRGDDVGVTEDIPAHSNGKIRIIKSISGIIIILSIQLVSFLSRSKKLFFVIVIMVNGL